MEYYSVTIWECQADMNPWTSVFPTREKAESFKKKAERIIRKHGLDLIVTIDYGALDSEGYLDCLEEGWC